MFTIVSCILHFPVFTFLLAKAHEGAELAAKQRVPVSEAPALNHNHLRVTETQKGTLCAEAVGGASRKEVMERRRGSGRWLERSSPRRNINKREMRRHLETDRKKC